PKNNISTNDDIQQGLKRGHQMVASREGRKSNEHLDDELEMSQMGTDEIFF
ncbi:unnamed protein product, partial [Rotaria sp. Silwood1]